MAKTPSNGLRLSADCDLTVQETERYIVNAISATVPALVFLTLLSFR